MIFRVSSALQRAETFKPSQIITGLSGLPGSLYRTARFGPWGNVLHYGRVIDIDALQDFHWNINIWTDDEVIQWKNSQLATYNAIAVASAIFASIGLTALQLPNMYDVHWTARALCASSMALGVLSVSAATSQYQSIAQLNDALSVRLWLSRGRPMPYIDGVNNWWSVQFRIWTTPISRQVPHDGRVEDKYINTPFETMPLESAISALGSIWLPRNLLDLAAFLFLIGFGLYFLFLWLDNIGSAGTANRDAFIIYVAVVVLMLLNWMVLAQGHQWNQAKAARDVGLSATGAGSKQRDQVIKNLQEELAACQRLLRVTQHELKEVHSNKSEPTEQSQPNEQYARTGDSPTVTVRTKEAV